MKIRAGPDGIHIFDRLTGDNLLVDEAEVPSELWSDAPRQVSIALTNACDLRCPFCYAPKFPARLSDTKIRHWLQELDAHGCLGVGFGGGEPTLYPHFSELCRFATENTALAVSFTTHAHHLDEELSAALQGNVHFLRVSMDGVGSTYEAIRGRSFLDFCQQLSLVRRIAPFGINFVVNQQTVSELSDAISIATEHGAREFLLLPEQAIPGRPGSDVNTRTKLRNWVEQYQGDVPLCVSETDADMLPTCNPLANEAGLRSYAHIDASGVIKRSSFEQCGVPIGDDGVMRALKRLEEMNEASL